jgi:hypothetical protein
LLEKRDRNDDKTHKLKDTREKDKEVWEGDEITKGIMERKKE